MRKVMVILMLLLVTSVTVSIKVSAQTSAEIQQQIDELNAQKEADIASINTNQASVDELQAEIDTTNQQIAEKQSSIDDLNSQISGLNDKINTLNAQIIDTQEQIEQKEAEAKPLAEQCADSLVAMQHMGHTNFIVDTVFGGNADASSIIKSYKSLQTITSSLLSNFSNLIILLEEIQQKEAELETQKADVTKQKADLETKQSQLLVDQAALQDAKDYNEALQASLQEKISEAEGDLYDANAAIQSKQDTLNFLDSAGCGPSDVYGVDCGVSTGGGGSAPITEQSGFIRPTNSGQVVNEFMGAELGGNGFGHTGIDIANTCGTTVYPSADGVVTSVFYDSSGGNQVTVLSLVDGQNYVTNYAHLSSASVAPGQNVSVNTPLGSMGQTGVATGCHLHFEMNTGTQWAWAIGQPSLFFNPRQMVNFPASGQWYYTRY